MPYRRLPTTDTSRLKALKAAAVKAEQVNLDSLAFSTRYLHHLRNYHQQLQSIKFEQTQAWNRVLKQNRLMAQNTDKVRIYLSHFIQVLNMSIMREEIPPKARTLYGLPEDSKKLPALQSNKSLLEWGENIINGESKRIRSGGTPLMNPTIAKVKVWYDRFKDLYHSQEVSQKSYERSNAQLVNIRRKIDLLIQATWNEIEEFYEKYPEEERRDLCRKYGIVYVYRSSEKNPSSAAPQS